MKAYRFHLKDLYITNIIIIPTIYSLYMDVLYLLRVSISTYLIFKPSKNIILI